MSDDHHSFEEYVSICLIDKADPSDPHERKYYWMRTLKTIALFGFNTEETYLALHFFLVILLQPMKKTVDGTILDLPVSLMKRSSITLISESFSKLVLLKVIS